MLSEVVWIVIGAVALLWELVGLFTYKRSGIEPLTFILRDRLMRRSGWVKGGVLVFWIWLGLHFFLDTPYW